MVKYNQHKQITVEKRFQLVQELSQLKLSDWIQSAPNTQTFKWIYFTDYPNKKLI